MGRTRGLANEQIHRLLFESDNNVSDLDSDDDNKLKSSPSNVYMWQKMITVMIVFLAMASVRRLYGQEMKSGHVKFSIYRALKDYLLQNMWTFMFLRAK